MNIKVASNDAWPHPAEVQWPIALWWPQVASIKQCEAFLSSLNTLQIFRDQCNKLLKLKHYKRENKLKKYKQWIF